jgi:predicted RNA binding protein YcfA (HicA-like mRNA interferase family)
MTRRDWRLQQLLHGRSDASLQFKDLRAVLLQLGFVERVRGSHHVFSKPGISEILNLQSCGHEAKAYQVRQVRKLIQRHNLGGGHDP